MAKKKRKQVMPQTLEAAEYVSVLATVAATAFNTETVLELYRARRQVELAFKRLKSLMQAGHVPKYDEASARAWIQDKLLAVFRSPECLEWASFKLALTLRQGSASPGAQQPLDPLGGVLLYWALSDSRITAITPALRAGSVADQRART